MQQVLLVWRKLGAPSRFVTLEVNIRRPQSSINSRRLPLGTYNNLGGGWGQHQRHPPKQQQVTTESISPKPPFSVSFPVPFPNPTAVFAARVAASTA